MADELKCQFSRMLWCSLSEAEHRRPLSGRRVTDHDFVPPAAEPLPSTDGKMGDEALKVARDAYFNPDEEQGSGFFHSLGEEWAFNAGWRAALDRSSQPTTGGGA